MPEGMEAGLEAVDYYDPPNLTFPFGTYICVVDIDKGTGEVKVRRFVAVDDCGNIINPMIVEGQIHGGLTEGLAIAFMQQIDYDESGNVQGGSFMDYLLPTAVETPHWETGKTCTPSPHHPFGAKGVGESPNVGSPAAFVNAVVDALSHLGVKHIDMPIAPWKVWNILKEKGMVELTMAIQIEKKFQVKEPVDKVWGLLSDPRRVATCVPGAKITEQVDEKNYKGTITVKVGPSATEYKGELEIVRLDSENHELEMIGKGQDVTGRGSASMKMTAKLRSLQDGGTEVTSVSEVNVVGILAQMGSRMISEVSNILFAQFIKNFQAQLQQPAGAAANRSEAPQRRVTRMGRGKGSATPRILSQRRRQDQHHVNFAAHASKTLIRIRMP